MNEKLLQRVEEAMREADDYYISQEQIWAGVVAVIEEAAKVADDYHRVVEQKRDLFEDGNITFTKGHTLVDPRKIAAAIRKLKGDA